jgi:hypothetical protein
MSVAVHPDSLISIRSTCAGRSLQEATETNDDSAAVIVSVGNFRNLVRRGPTVEIKAVRFQLSLE